MALQQRKNRGANAAAVRNTRRALRRGLLLLLALALTGLALNFLPAGPRASAQDGAARGEGQRGSRGAGVRPKKAVGRAAAPTAAPPASKLGAKSKLPASTMESLMAEALSPVLASADFDLVGLAVTADPATQTVPKNTPTSVLTSVRVPQGGDPAAIIAGLSPTLRVRGELTGPSLAGPLALEAPIGQQLPIPPLNQAGEHLVQNLRVVDVSAPEESVVAPVFPDACGIVVIERLLVSEVRVNELSYEQIVQAGINLTNDSYRAFNFTLGVGTTSNAQFINIPVAFPPVGVNAPRPIVGTATSSAPGVDVPTVVPVMLSVPLEDEGGNATRPEIPMVGDEPLRIPGVIVFPGRVGFLNQFFEAIVIVSNGAPGGTPLVLRNLRARAKLPDAGTPADASDDPLRIAETQTGGRVTELDLHGLGADEKYGTADDALSFRPGESGQATFLLEGLKEGMHTVNFALEATLDGLPSGPVRVVGEVPGAVLVRDASFAVTFTHPNVVRAGQEYDLAMTVYNSGSRDIQGAFAQLARNSISGAELLGQDTGARQFPGTIKRKDQATIKWRLRAAVTGEVTASYVKVGDDVSAGLALVTGVGDRGVPLSPDSLILPDPVKHLPPGVVEAARAVLGQGWSIANAPPGSLPQGVMPMTKQSVIDRAVELGLAGMRVDFGEPVSVSLDTLLRDWLGEIKQDAGFSDALRHTPAGEEFFDSVGAEIYKRLNAPGGPGVSPSDFHRELSDAESPRSPFISALVTHAGGPEPLAGSRLVNTQGEKVGFGPVPGERAGALDAGASLRLSKTDVITGAQTYAGQMTLVSNPANENWTLELEGWQSGAADISLLYPGTSRTYKQAVWGGVQIEPGGKYRVSFRPASSTTTAPVLEILSGGAWVPAAAQASVATLSQPAPRLVGAIQVTPEVVAGGDKYGRLVGLLFSKPMLREQATVATKYTVGGGKLKNSDEMVGGPVRVKGAALDYGDRFVFLSLDMPIGPYVERDVTVSGVGDARRTPLAPSPTTMAIGARVSPQGIPPGAYLTGRVLNADGTPVAGASVIYWTQECPNPAIIALPPPPMPIAVRVTDAQGRYAMDYVRDGDCAPLSVTVTNPATQSEKRLTTPVAYDGQHLVFDMVFLARGNVRGTVTSGDRVVPNAFVSIIPSLDVVGAQVVRTDEAGNYSATGVPVGHVSITAVGTGDFAIASGLAAGTIPGPNMTATVNVSMQNTSGEVSGRVQRPDGGHAVGSLVIAYARVPGFGNINRSDGKIAAGYAYADAEGRFKISNIPLNDVTLEVTDYVTGLRVSQNVTLTPQTPVASNLLLTLPGLGSVSGRVTNETGAPVADAIVMAAGQGVKTDAGGNYVLRNLPAGRHGVTARHPETGQTGSASATVAIGQTAENVNIVILRPAAIEGTVYILEEGSTTPKPASGAYVSSDGYDIVQADAQGKYRINSVSPNTQLHMRFVKADKGYGLTMPVILTPGETLTRDVTFKPGTIRGRVTQPDGVTGTVADLNVFTPRPYLEPGPNFGFLSTEYPRTTRSNADGTYTLAGNNPGQFRVSTSNVFFPTPVSAGGTLAPSGVAECNLSLVDTLAGKIQGRVFQPDGVTPVGPNVRVSLGGGSLADATVRTDDEGRYVFGEVFSAGGYQLTATDPVTGSTNRINVSVQRNQDAVFDIRLLGAGSLKVRVVDGGGQPVRSGSVTLNGSDYPRASRFAEITPDRNGVIEFNNLPEGAYAVAATERGLGGRASVNIGPGASVETTIQLQASGTVEGRVFMPGGSVPIGLADVQLTAGGRSIGFSVTTDVEGDPEATGHFKFLNVPAGDFTLDVFDNRTGRSGRSAGRISVQDETATVNVYLLAAGAVTGRVTSNGLPVDHALVEINADGSGVRGVRLKATTDADGRYRFTGIPAGRFTVNVTDAPGGQGGSVSGIVSGTTEPLPDTVADITLEPTQTVTGTVYKLGGAEPLPGALITLRVNNNRIYRTTTNEQGVYRVSFVALGVVVARAEAPAGYDRGEGAPVTGTQPGGSVTADVTLDGVGRVAGVATDNNGVPLGVGNISYTNNAWGSALQFNTSVRADGSYEFKDVPAGAFTLKLTVPGRVGVGSGAGAVVADQTVDVPLRLEDAGRVTGRVVAESTLTPVTGADVTLTLWRATGGSLLFYAHTDSQGAWAFENIPLGAVSVSVLDPTTGGKALTAGASLVSNAQVVDLGDMRLDATPIRVESVTPSDATTGVSPTNATVTVNFSEPAQSGSVNSGTLKLLSGTSGVSASVTPAADGRSATLKPSGRLADTTTYTVVATTGIRDVVGLPLASEFRSTFTTSDETAPSVVSVVPANNAERVPINTSLIVTFNEALAGGQPLAEIVKLAPEGGQPLEGSYTLGDAGKTVTFTPVGGLNEGTRYAVSVTGQRDPAGNIQSSGFNSFFSTLDQSAPVIDPLPIDGQRVRSFRPNITATYRDNLSGVKVSSVVLTLDGAAVTAGATVTGTGLSYTPPSPLSRGDHTVTVRAADNEGNLSEPRSATFHIDDSGPIITGFTIAGAPASDGMFVTSTLRPVFSVTYNDDTGADPAASKLLVGFGGATPQPVGATVTDTALTYQSPTPMAEGQYTVEAVVVNNLGTSTSTGRVTFTLDVNAPQLASITPPSGTQHGGTQVTITGDRLLNSVPSPEGPGTGLLGDYYYNTDFTELKFQRTDPAVNFDWGANAPDLSLRPQKHSIRWSGQIVPEFTESYTLTLWTATRVKLWIDDQLVIDNTAMSVEARDYSGAVNLVAGQRHNIRIDYFQVAHNSFVRLDWQSASRPRQPVPQSRLYPNQSGPAVYFGGTRAKLLSAAAGTPDVVVVESPAGAPGPADVEVVTNRGRGTAHGGFSYEADARTPFMPEPDTLLLWHLDETQKGATTILDTAGILNGTSDADSTVQPGRFNRGRARANIASGQDIENVLALGTSSFTAECWFKTGPVQRTYTLIGKDYDNVSTPYYNSEFVLQLMPGGGMRTFIHDVNGTQWKAEMAPTAYDVDDDQWHHAAMVLDRGQQRLVLYVDGVERASRATGIIPALYPVNQPLRLGHYDSAGPVTPGTSAPTEFPGVLDEFRLSSTAHSAEKIRQTYLGTEGTLGLVVLKYSPYLLARGSTIQMSVSGYNLTQLTAVATDAGGNQLPTRTLTSSANQATLELTVAPEAVLGGGQITFTTGAGSATRSLLVVELGQSVYGVEPDTRLLWHLDETGNGAARILDVSTYSIDGRADSDSTAVTGRFGGGRKRAQLAADSDNGLLTFGTSSFTVECWFKTGPVERTYTLLGKGYDTASTPYYNSEFALQIMPSGGMRAIVHDINGTQWKAQMPATMLDIDDDQWHHAALVLDRDAQKLMLYVDGIERASRATGIFPTLYPNSQPLRAGHYDSAGPVISGTSAPTEFPGVLDEIRVSATAHSAARMRSDFEGNSGLFITSVTPREVKRNRASAGRAVTTLGAEGYDLRDMNGRVERQGEVLDVNVSVFDSSYRSARLELAVGPDVRLGYAKLVFSKPGQPEVSVDIYITETSELVADTDTVVLWHLNETADSRVTILDSGPLSIDAKSDSDSRAAPGHFLGGRTRANIAADADFGAVSFGTSSFTAECWFKTGPVERTYTLLGKGYETASTPYYNGEFALQIMPSGAMRAVVHDINGTQWKAEVAPTVYDMDDDQWHHAAMVLDRAAQRLVLYIDGVERASRATGIFPTLYPNSQPFRAGHYDSAGPVVSGTNAPTEFPGVLDEIRLSSTAHSAERVASDALGYDTLRLTRIQPPVLQRGTTNVPVTLMGNGLSNATVTANRPEVGVTVVSTAPTQIELLVSVPVTSAVGPLQFTATDPFGQTATASNEVVDQKPFENTADDNNSTILLWHLDETANGNTAIAGSGDPVPAVVGGTADADSTSTDGRFGKGRIRSNIAAASQTSSHTLGTSSFTAECWFKTPPVERTYTLLGKGYETASTPYYNGEFALQLMPGGGMRAVVHDINGTQWKAEMAARTYDPATGQWLVTLDDERWHHAAMVLDRTAQKLTLYVDGVERGSRATGIFPTLYTNSQPFRAGHYDSAGPAISGTNATTEFPGVLDEVRLVKYPRTAAQIRETWTGAPATTSAMTQSSAAKTPMAGATVTAAAAAPAAAPASSSRPSGEGAREAQPTLRVISMTPNEVTRDRASNGAQTTEVVIEGGDLKGVTAKVLRDDQPLDIKVKVLESSDERARLSLAVAPSVPLGLAQLVLSKPEHPDAGTLLRVTEPSEFAVEADTTLLWRMDEAEHGAARLSDAGPASAEALADSASKSVPGRFGGGRASARAATAGPLAPSSPSPSPSSGFTVESWFKSGPAARDYILVGRGPGRGRESDWTLSLLPSGALRARVYDASGIEWLAETGETGFKFDDDRWHSAAMVVDRESDTLKIYVDGRLHASALKPVEFGEVRNQSQTLMAGSADGDAAPAETPEAWPGVLDEIRVSSTAHSAEKVAADYWGHDAPEVTYVPAAALPRGGPPAPLTLSGYGLAGAKVTSKQADVRAVVKASTRTSLELLVSLPSGGPAGTITLEVTDPLGQTTTFAVKVAESAGAKTPGRSGAQARASVKAESSAPPEQPSPPPPSEAFGQQTHSRGAGGRQ